MQLKSVKPYNSIDNKHIRLDIKGQSGESCEIEMSSETFNSLLYNLNSFATQVDIEKALPVQEPETDPASQDHALLIATDVNLVRWEAGAAALQIQTALGVALQIGFTPEHVSFLRKALSQSI